MFTYMRLHSIPTDHLFVSKNSQGETKQEMEQALSPLIYVHPTERRSMVTRARTYQSSLALKRICLIETHVFPSPQLRGLGSSNLLLEAFGSLSQRRQAYQVLPDAFRRESEHRVADRQVVICQRVSFYVHITTPLRDS